MNALATGTPPGPVRPTATSQYSGELEAAVGHVVRAEAWAFEDRDPLGRPDGPPKRPVGQLLARPQVQRPVHWADVRVIEGRVGGPLMGHVAPREFGPAGDHGPVQVAADVQLVPDGGPGDEPRVQQKPIPFRPRDRL